MNTINNVVDVITFSRLARVHSKNKIEIENEIKRIENKER